MKKGLIYLLCSVLIFTLLAPLSVAAQNSEVSTEIEGITFIKDTDEESIYRIEEEGKY